MKKSHLFSIVAGLFTGVVAGAVSAMRDVNIVLCLFAAVVVTTLLIVLYTNLDEG